MSYLLFMETSGNQAYLYATNRLKENIGASELTYRTGTKWLLEAVAQAEGPDNLWINETLDRDALRQGEEKGGISVILATSGKGLVRVDSREKAEQIMAFVSERALIEAPGLDICGAIVQLESEDVAGFAKAYGAAHHRYNKFRNLMPSPLQRHPMLPGVKACTSSGLPASTIQITASGTRTPLADATAKKREAAAAWFKRINGLVTTMNASSGTVALSKSVDQLEKRFENMDWVGVVFADGNGLGQLFMKFDQHLQALKIADYAATLREFSIAIDECTEAAFYAACKELGEGEIPVVPLVLGGDDLTLVMDGRRALDFTKTFLEVFESESGEKEIIRKIAQQGLGAPRLSACAGVAIVKPHFPFHAAHELAEALLKSAKEVKKHVLHPENGQPYPCSALDFHILYDSTFHDIELLRKERRTLQEKDRDKTKTYRLYGGPYVVTSPVHLNDTTGKEVIGRQWALGHSVQHLIKRAHAMLEKDEDGRYVLPNSQMHGLRETLLQGAAAVDGRLADLRRQFGEHIEDFYENPEQTSLFRADEPDSTHYSTRFLDAISSSEFWSSPSPKASNV